MTESAAMFAITQKEIRKHAPETAINNQRPIGCSNDTMISFVLVNIICYITAISVTCNENEGFLTRSSPSLSRVSRSLEQAIKRKKKKKTCQTSVSFSISSAFQEITC